MSFQIDYNYTKKPNFIVDEYAKNCPDATYKILDYLVRKILGFNQTSGKISQTEIINATGKHKTTVSKALKKLILDGILIVVKPATLFSSTEYAINTQWTTECMKSKTTSEAVKSAPIRGSQKLPNKEKHLKKTFKEKMHHAFSHNFSLEKEPELPTINSEGEIEKIKELLKDWNIKGKNLTTISQCYKPEEVKKQIEYMPYRSNIRASSGYLVKAIKKDYSAPKAFKKAQEQRLAQEKKQNHYAETLEKIKELGQFFIAGIRCTVTKVEGNVVHYTRLNMPDSRGIVSLIECAGAKV